MLERPDFRELIEFNQVGESGIVSMIRLSRRYEAFSRGNGFPLLANMIQPVASVDEVIRTHSVFSENLDLTGGGSAHVAAVTVPVGRRYTLTHLIRGSSTGNTRLEVVKDGTRVPLSNSDANTLRMLEINPIVLGPGDTIGMLESGNGGDGSINTQGFYTDEVAF